MFFIDRSWPHGCCVVGSLKSRGSARVKARARSGCGETSRSNPAYNISFGPAAKLYAANTLTDVLFHRVALVRPSRTRITSEPRPTLQRNKWTRSGTAVPTRRDHHTKCAQLVAAMNRSGCQQNVSKLYICPRQQFEAFYNILMLRDLSRLARLMLASDSRN